MTLAPSADLGTTDVLVVDDDADMRVLVVMRIRQLGWEVRGAANGRHALDLAAQHPPALMIVDIGLPDMSGWDVIDTLRSRPATCDVPVVVLSIRTGLRRCRPMRSPPTP